MLGCLVQLFTVTIAGHAEEWVQLSEHLKVEIFCSNVISESKREWNCTGDVQGRCLPDKVSTRYCSSDGYSTVSSGTVPNTKNNHRRGTNQYTSNATV